MHPILEFFVKENIITEEKARSFADTAGINTSAVIESTLIESGVAEDVVRNTIAKYYDVTAFVLDEDTVISQDALSYLTEDSAEHYRVVPLRFESGTLHIGTNNPDDLAVREALNFISTKHNIPYRFHFLLNKDIDTLLESYANIKGEVTDALTSLEQELNTGIKNNLEEENKDEPVESYENIKEDAPVTKIVATILRYAVDGGASDIHVEPIHEKVKVRFRVDGELQTSLELPKNIQMAVVARIKIIASMRLDERRKPQDGRFSATFDDRKIDFRVSILPTKHGEKVVMRILDNEKSINKLPEVGVSEHHLGIIQKVLQEPYGIILVSGPTGSGKSTTLYAMLEEIDKDSQNVMSLEDPIEYDMAGVSQSQVRPEIGYTFANGLRASLRQDPDIIMVGEIRDKETAQLAIQAALTGHLVISTIHTNNSIGVIPRLVDMGVDPYLIAPTLKLVIAQRLARRLYKDTGTEEPISESTKLMIEDTFADLPESYRHVIPDSKTMKLPEPSPGCATGLRGRIAVMETLQVNDEIQKLILAGASEEEMYTAARKYGFTTLYEDAIIKALKHQIPPAEMSSFESKIINTVDPAEELPVDN